MTQYESNAINQYASMGGFTPEFDLAGNQTLAKTTTGTWQVTYNAENRPIRFESEDGSTVVQCGYDYMGRRCYKKVTTNGKVTLHQRYIYRGYLHIACCDLTRSWQPALWYILWDPTQTVATRPLAIQKDGAWYTYGWDLTKNICELYGQSGYIRTIYTYTPYGAVTAEGDVDQRIQWSSEYNDAELGLVYYNYRHYNVLDARWLNRDRIRNISNYKNMYGYIRNRIGTHIDILGLDTVIIIGSPSLNRDSGRHDKYAWNFLNLGLRRAGDSVKSCWYSQYKKCCCIVRVIVYKPGYDRRTQHDSRTTANVQDLVDKWKSRLGEGGKCVNISYTDSADEILDILKSLGSNSVDQLDYVGHSSSNALFVEYGSIPGINDGTDPEDEGVAWSDDSIDNDDLVSAMNDKFSSDAEFNHMGCYGKGLAQQMNDEYNVNSHGASDKTSYEEAGKAGSPAREPYGVDSHFPRDPNK